MQRIHLLIVVQRMGDYPPPALCPPAAGPKKKQSADSFGHPGCDSSGSSASRPSPKSSTSDRRGKAGSS